jgi:hypothetical protein
MQAPLEPRCLAGLWHFVVLAREAIIKGIDYPAISLRWTLFGFSIKQSAGLSGTEEDSSVMQVIYYRQWSYKVK